ncbi:MAG: fasciclin domain-containing protein [Prevotella sp.]|nr:fasciclin domain-containing protein [Prevotella sp.]
MNYRFFELTKKALYGLCLAVISGGFLSCNDRFPLDDEGNYPSWLGSSVYEQLKNPNPEVLTGTFNNYVRLIEDMGYAETLGKTGSKTVFAANDEAFERFYANNAWGVRKYEDLTEAMKKQLLYSSMLDNAILVEMLSNVSYDATSVTPGIAMKHTTGANVIDTITFIPGPAGMPKNNSYWQKYFDKGINLVMDATRPMMVHFTAEQLTNNSITTRGENSDFEVITGTPYNDEENSAYIFRNKIIKGDVTCKNGYIHQLQDVLVPPGNIAELIRTNGESFYFSRMLDRFSVPVYDAATTNNYNDFAQANGLPLIDSIFQKRYFSSRSQGSDLTVDPNGAIVKSVLPYDPGWNTYTNGMSGSNALSDLAAIFVPTDEAMKTYFLPGGSGSFIIDQYGKKENTEENLAENIDSIPQDIVQAFLDNLMKSSFVGTVPSKFGDVMDDASDPMGLSLDVLNKNADGTYDVKIANNGVAYMLNTVFAPNRYIAVSAPALLTDNMRIMNTAIQDGYNGNTTVGLNQNFYAYLLAMSANYAFFIPTDKAFGQFYVDPTYLMHDQPRALRFYYQNRSPYVFCSQWQYNPLTGEIGDSIGTVATSAFRSHLIDILNYHTVVLGEGEKFGTNEYYKTKHGGEIHFFEGRVESGGQIDNRLSPSFVVKQYNQKNGVSYAIDHVIQAPQKSVYSVLGEYSQFEEFNKLCNGYNEDLFFFASDKMKEVNQVTKKQRVKGYELFVNEVGHFGLDYDVKFFNSYNYTVYVPDNEAMKKAYALGLPTWSDVQAIYDEYHEKWEEQQTEGNYSEDVIAARNKALAMLEEINAFIRYHFQDNSVYLDKNIEAGVYATACSDTLGVREKLTVSGANRQMTVVDKSGQQVNISSTGSNVVNKMTRDYVFDKAAKTAGEIRTSSFAVIHQIPVALNSHAGTNRYDTLWTGANAKKKLAAFRRLYDSKLYKQY